MISPVARIVSIFIFRNFLIAICAMAMVLSTFMVNNLPLRITPFTAFITIATFLLYNFHRISFRLDFSKSRNFLKSLRRIRFKAWEKFFYPAAAVSATVLIFRFDAEVYLYLIPLVFISIAYSVPMFGKKGKRIKLSEVILIKTPAVAFVWGFSTTAIPLVEQNIDLLNPFIVHQIISRCLFVFVLCLVFELRDCNADRKRGILTLPVIAGVRATVLTGIFIVAIEIILHHLMRPLSLPVKLALDASSLLALFWLISRNDNKKPGFYKLLVDGTMIVRFVFLYFSSLIL